MAGVDGWLWRLRRWLIAWLAGADTIVLNAIIKNGVLHCDHKRRALIQGCTFGVDNLPGGSGLLAVSEDEESLRLIAYQLISELQHGQG